MNLLHLKYIVEVEKSGSISKAADNLYMGQPNLSRMLKDLESEIGFEIFKRTSQGIVVTKKGAEFLRQAREVLSKISEMENMFKNKDESKLNFSISIPRASYITNAFTKFVNKLDQNKGISINYKETNSMEAINNIIDNDYNLGIIRYQNTYEEYFLNLLEEKDIKYQPVWEFEFKVIMSKEHPLACRKCIFIDELSEYIQLVHGDVAIPSLGMPHFNKNNEKEDIQKQIRVYERGSQFDILSQVHTSYMWASPIPQDICSSFGIVEIPCIDEIPSNKDVLIYPRGYKFSDLDRMFIEELDNVKNKLAE